MVGAFDYAGWSAAFAICLCAVPIAIALYANESRGPRRPDRMLRYRYGIGSALVVTLLVGLRRFVLHQ
jgi:hypothetical protein